MREPLRRQCATHELSVGAELAGVGVDGRVSILVIVQPVEHDGKHRQRRERAGRQRRAVRA
jgi:hypothetical protein